MHHERDYQLIPPPRPVPLSLRFQVLFGGIFSQIGWLFFGFGLIPVWIFTATSNLPYIFTFQGKLESVQGKITERESTDFSSNGRIIKKYKYCFEINGQKFEDCSYSERSNCKNTDTVTVEFPANTPSISRIRGMSKEMLPAWAGLIPLVFPLLGFCFIMVGLKNGGKNVYLLKNGEMGKGRLISKLPTNLRVSQQTVYPLTFEIEINGRPCETTIKSHYLERFKDPKGEALFYDPMVPSFAELMDNLPGSPEIDENGYFKPKTLTSTLLAMILPLLSIGGHGIVVFFKYFA